ncbi:MAG: DUF5615 family PIN-like protein [Acidobacteriota bacterium]|nr:DUF5615 family PIN-like protein [Acidobacteriota bacterium]
MKIRFLADANFNQRIVAGLLLRQPQIDFGLPQDLIPAGATDPKVLGLGATLSRVIVTHDVRTMPIHFQAFVNKQACAGVILVPTRMVIGDVIEDLLLIWYASEAEEWRNRMRRLPL